MEYNNTSSDMCNGAHTGHQHTQNLIRKQRQRTIYYLHRRRSKPSVYSYLEKGCPQKCARDVPERKYGIWSIHRSRHCSCQHIFFCFPSARANIRPWPLVPFFQISLKNSKLKTTHNTFRDCRVHFFRQPFSKQLYTTNGLDECVGRLQRRLTIHYLHKFLWPFYISCSLTNWAV